MADAPERIWAYGEEKGGDQPEWRSVPVADATEFIRADLVAELVKALEEAATDALASLVAAVSLLERGGKRAAPSDKMFAVMLADYNASIERTRAALTRIKGDGK